MNIHHKPQSNTCSLKESVLQRIEAGEVQPKPKWWFLCGECLMYVLWAISVILGAVAISVIIFVAEHSMFALFEATHESAFDYAIDTVPVAWIVVFVLMAVLAYYNYRHTTTGYRYSLIAILGSSTAFSIVGGVLLHSGGVGAYLDTQLAENMPMYESLERKELKMWLQPEEGRLVGRLAGAYSEGTTTEFVTADGAAWELVITELLEPDRIVLQNGGTVRVLGMVVTSTANTFYGCGVFPWMYDKVMSYAELQAERRAFIERMYAHKEKLLEQQAELAQFVANAPGRREDSVCAGHNSVDRIEARMQ